MEKTNMRHSNLDEETNGLGQHAKMAPTTSIKSNLIVSTTRVDTLNTVKFPGPPP
jgi:hypothetical protein